MGTYDFKDITKINRLIIKKVKSSIIYGVAKFIKIKLHIQINVHNARYQENI